MMQKNQKNEKNQQVWDWYSPEANHIFTASYRTFVLFIFATVSHLDEILYASSTPFSLLSFPCCLAMISLLIFNRSWIDFLAVYTVFDFSFPTDAIVFTVYISDFDTVVGSTDLSGALSSRLQNPCKYGSTCSCISVRSAIYA